MIELAVSHDDISEMSDRMQSGIIDICTENAVSIALRKRVKSEYTPQIYFAPNHNACELRIAGEWLVLPSTVYWWLRKIESGAAAKPSVFSIAIYLQVLKDNEIPSARTDR